MTIDFTEFTLSLSYALDFAEKALLNVNPYHGLRIAIMVLKMAERAGYDEKTKHSLVQAALLHDCALSEYFKEEFSKDNHNLSEKDMAAHCAVGEKILNKLPFYENVKGAVLYHHDCADGSGSFKKTSDQTPMYAQMIHIADAVDVKFDLYSFEDNKYLDVCKYVKENIGKKFGSKVVDIFLSGIDLNLFNTISGEAVKNWYNKIFDNNLIDVSIDVLYEMASIFATITDYKSHFTLRHSKGVAEKAEIMGQYYGYDTEKCKKYYIAGSLHDIGKLLIDDNILEKPGKLTQEEYSQIQNHAVGTWNLLHKVKGIEDIAHWAALHHEKLDGSGYPFKYSEEQLDKDTRLFACIDIYQALVEDRPYKNGMSHSDAMNILYKMGNSGQLDLDIIKDIDLCFASSCEKEMIDSTKEENKTVNGVSYKCPVCGYVYEGESIPEDFICPSCEQPGSIFEKQ